MRGCKVHSIFNGSFEDAETGNERKLNKPFTSLFLLLHSLSQDFISHANVKARAVWMSVTASLRAAFYFLHHLTAEYFMPEVNVNSLKGREVPHA
jgi:hypothetical protein